MRLGKYLSSLTTSELDELRQQLNLTDDELKVFNELSKGRCSVAVSERCGISTSTVSNRIKGIVTKCQRVELKGSDIRVDR